MLAKIELVVHPTEVQYANTHKALICLAVRFPTTRFRQPCNVLASKNDPGKDGNPPAGSDHKRMEVR